MHTLLETAVLAAIGTVPAAVCEHALGQVTAYTAQVNRAAADPNTTTVSVHLDRAAYWACIARENGATEQQISAARQEGHTTAAQQQA